KLTDLQTWLVSLERALMLLDQTPEIAESAKARTLLRASGRFELRDVSFQYHETSRGLRNISFEIPAGARVGIVGATGAGKSTAFRGRTPENLAGTRLPAE